MDLSKREMSDEEIYFERQNLRALERMKKCTRVQAMIMAASLETITDDKGAPEAAQEVSIIKQLLRLVGVARSAG